MRRTITLLVSGTLGDVRPLVALGVGLRNAGYVVRVATHAHYAPLVQAHGLLWRRVEGNPSDLLRSDDAALTLDRGALRGAAATLRYMCRAQAVYARMIDSATEACRESDALIVSLASCWGQLIATALELPCIWAPLQPNHAHCALFVATVAHKPLSGAPELFHRRTDHVAPVAHRATPMAVARAQSAPRAARPLRAGAAVARTVHLWLQSMCRSTPSRLGPTPYRCRLLVS